jgi:membrane protease YdiL (CAAX protease family)
LVGGWSPGSRSSEIVTIQYSLTCLPATRQLGVFPLLAVAVLLTLLVALLAAGQVSRSEHTFAATLLAFAGFLAVMLMFAGAGLPERLSKLAGPAGAWLLGVVLLFLYLLYGLGTGTLTPPRTAALAAFLFLPLSVLAAAGDRAPGSWHDFLTLGMIWAGVKFGPSHWLWPYPGGRLAYVFTVVTAVDLALAGFLLLRRTKDVGYRIDWAAGWTFHVAGPLVLFALIAIPLGMYLHFIAYQPRLHEWRTLLPLSIGILFFTAWPEELLFRGLLQNLASRAVGNDTLGWIAASLLFGLSHISNLGFPNWRYVLLASIAGLFYGWTWRRTGSLFASALVHASVDILWHFLFRTL